MYILSFPRGMILIWQMFKRLTRFNDFPKPLTNDSVSHKTSDHKILQSLEGASLGIKMLGAAETPAKFQSNRNTLTTDLAPSKLCEFLWRDAFGDLK